MAVARSCAYPGTLIGIIGRICTLCGVGLLAVASCLIAAPRALGQEAEHGDNRWIPSVAMGIVMQTPDPTGTVVTSIRPPTTGGETLVAFVPDLRAELMSPTLRLLPGQPRVFVHFGWQYGWKAFDYRRNIARAGNPGEVVFPRLPALQDPNSPENVARVDGQGIESKARIDTAWSVGAGLAFETRPWGRAVWIRPSIDYYQQHVELEGSSINAVSADPDFLPSPIESVVGRAGGTLRALSPRLALDLELGKRGPVLLSLFGEVQALWFLGDRTVAAPAKGDGTGVFTYGTESVRVQAGVGLRLSWQPEG